MAKPANLIDTLSRNLPHEHEIARQACAHLREAHRFVLDDEMSAFMVDLSYAGFDTRSRSRIYKNAEWIRESARLPFPVTWIEWNQHARMRRRSEVRKALKMSGVNLELVSPAAEWAGRDEDSLEGIDRKAGWLLQHAKKGDERLICTIVWGDVETGFTHVVPVAYMWSTDDNSLLPLFEDQTQGSQLAQMSLIATGLPGYLTHQATIFGSRDVPSKIKLRYAQELAGELRYVWAFLASLNQVPVTIEPRAGVGGYMARRQYRRYLDYSVIHLKIPGKRTREQLARTVIALARRARHQVRGHWRRDWRHPGERVWVKPHERGDATLGYVVHDYSIEHEAEREQPCSSSTSSSK